jgi:hypothetical protein
MRSEIGNLHEMESIFFVVCGNKVNCPVVEVKG